jgi:hypothetical protein
MQDALRAFAPISIRMLGEYIPGKIRIPHDVDESAGKIVVHDFPEYLPDS